MSTNLAKAIKKFYEREQNKVVFKNKMSLNQLALEMWEKLEYQQIDASVISKVINGIRLFTPIQLKTFCSILNISRKEEEYLHYCLYMDYCSRYGVNFSYAFFSTYDAYDLLDSLIKEAEKFLLDGKCVELKNLSLLTQTHLRSLLDKSKNSTRREKANQLLGKSLYLKGRAVGSVETPDKAVKKTMPIANELFCLAKESESTEYNAYAHILLANAYYVAGGYSSYEGKRKLYEQSIKFAKKAVLQLSDQNHEKLFAIRTIASSATYMDDKQTFLSIKDTAEDLLTVIPQQNFVNGIHLYNTLAKGAATFALSKPLSTKNKALDYFDKTLEGTHIYEVSDIRNDLEIFSILKTTDVGYIKERVNKALYIAKEEGYIRHTKSIKNLCKKLLK